MNVLTLYLGHANKAARVRKEGNEVEEDGK